MCVWVRAHTRRNVNLSVSQCSLLFLRETLKCLASQDLQKDPESDYLAAFVLQKVFREADDSAAPSCDGQVLDKSQKKHFPFFKKKTEQTVFEL